MEQGEAILLSVQSRSQAYAILSIQFLVLLVPKVSFDPVEKFHKTLGLDFGDLGLIYKVTGYYVKISLKSAYLSGFKLGI